MEILIEAFNFVKEKNIQQLLYSFWFFLCFDFFRYVVLDLVVIIYYFFKRSLGTKSRLIARQRLFNESPLVSVIVPGKNEGKHIPKLAASLSGQTYKNIEIIIVDDGSDDNSIDILRDLYRKGMITNFFRNDVRGGKASAANLALLYSKGKYIVHLDADSHLKDDSIEQILIPFFLDSKIGAVGGDIRVMNIGKSFASTLQAIDYMKSISTGRVVNSQLGILRIISGAYGAFRKDILDRLRGWDVGPGLDGDITLKIRKLGFKVCHEPYAVCYTNVPDSFRKLAKQRYRWDRSLIRFRIRKHVDLLNFRSKNFDLLNFITVLDNLIFNMLMNYKWWIYIIHMVFFNTEFLRIILIINYFLYFFSNVIEFTLSVFLYGKSIKRRELLLFLFVPLMPIYTGFFLRIVRTYAHTMELIHKTSFDDKWNPWKVSKVVKKQKF